MTTNKEAMREANVLHRDIMNLCCNELHAGTPNAAEQAAYGRGFKDARHAAAELAQAAIAHSEASNYTERDSLITQQAARIEQLEGMVAVKDEALKLLHEHARLYMKNYEGNNVWDCVTNAISSTAETVATFRDSATEQRDPSYYEARVYYGQKQL